MCHFTCFPLQVNHIYAFAIPRNPLLFNMGLTWVLNGVYTAKRVFNLDVNGLDGHGHKTSMYYTVHG